MRKVPNWDTYNMNSAVQAAERSKDPHTQVGAYICDLQNNPVSRGYNGFPAGMHETSERWQRPEKYKRVIHAELNAVLNAMRTGRSLENTKLYVTLHPCSRCALLIAGSGIKRIFYLETRDDPDYHLSAEILQECGVQSVYMTDYKRSR